MGGYGQFGYGSPFTPPVPGAGYQSFGDLTNALLQRLQDTSAVYTEYTEAQLYITEALRTLNALAPVWNADQLLTFNPGDTWETLDFPGSVRERSLTDTDLYTLMQYHLLEPPTGGTWTGTTQFNITSMAEALQYRCDELLQASAANVISFRQPSPTATNRTVLTNTILQLRRVRWIPAPVPGAPAPYALGREDLLTARAYGNNLILTPAPPDSYMVTSTPPYTFDCSSIPNVAGDWDILALQSGPDFVPPAATGIELPNDWCWVAKWGALADLLANSPEGTDRMRARYCEQRYARGLRAMTALPWLLGASVARVPCGVTSVQEMDAYAQDWEDKWPLDDPQVVVGGMDVVALAPSVLPTGQPVSTLLTVVGNAPVPVTDADLVQLSRDGVDAVLAYAQHLAQFKQGGAEFAGTLPLYEQFEAYCAATNARYAALGILRPEMLMEGGRGDVIDPRIDVEGLPKEEIAALRQQARVWQEVAGG